MSKEEAEREPSFMKSKVVEKAIWRESYLRGRRDRVRTAAQGSLPPLSLSLATKWISSRVWVVSISANFGESDCLPGFFERCLSLSLNLLYFNVHVSFFSGETNLPMIYLITPTYKRPEQIPDLTRLAQTLMHVPSITWLIIEDAESLSPVVTEILKRSGIRYVHLIGE